MASTVSPHHHHFLPAFMWSTCPAQETFNSARSPHRAPATTSATDPAILQSLAPPRFPPRSPAAVLQRSPTGTKNIGVPVTVPSRGSATASIAQRAHAGAVDESGPTQDNTYPISSPRILDTRFPCTSGQKGFLGGLAVKRAAGAIQVTQPHILPQLVTSH